MTPPEELTEPPQRAALKRRNRKVDDKGAVTFGNWIEPLAPENRNLFGMKRTVWLLILSLMPSGCCLVQARAHGTLGGCQANLKNIGTALEMYSTDYSGRYPTSLTRLTPDYLKTIPTCPTSGTRRKVLTTRPVDMGPLTVPWPKIETVWGPGHDTYSQHFVSSANPDLYTVVCWGTNHTGAGVIGHYPQYSSARGLIERP